MSFRIQFGASATFAVFVMSAGLTAAALAQTGQVRTSDAAKIEQLTGIKPTLVEAENVIRVAVARSDIKVTVDDTSLPAFAGLTSWAAFQAGKADSGAAPAGSGVSSGEARTAMVMGDLVLVQDEVNLVMDVCLAAGLSVTALHNHFFYDEPKIYFMHIGGEGSLEQLATGVRRAFDKVQEIRRGKPQPGGSFGSKPLAQTSKIDAASIEGILGKKGEAKDGMLKFSFGRTVKMSCGCKAGNAMGVNTWAALVGTEGHALVDGDFACLPGELQPTLKALRAAGINIVAIHNHMEDEEPRVIFLHYWAKGPASELAKGVKSALDAQAAVKAAAP